MLTTKLARKILSKKQQRHLTDEADIRSMAAMQRQVEAMMAEKAAHPETWEHLVCRECLTIARQLGMLD